jgi:hypothetical protein
MDLDQLLQRPEAARDEAWEQAFFKAIVPAKVQMLADQAQPGPDGWPYLLLKTGGEQATEPFSRILDWTSGKGVGLALNTHKMVPDYIFTYGMIWNFVLTGYFVSPQTAAVPGQVEFGTANDHLVGEPSPQYLPPQVRSVLRDFLNTQGFKSPKVVVVTSRDYKTTDLVFSIESLNHLGPAHHRTFAEALSWFLPQHYSLILGSESDFGGFVEL